VVFRDEFVVQLFIDRPVLCCQLNSPLRINRLESLFKRRTDKMQNVLPFIAPWEMLSKNGDKSLDDQFICIQQRAVKIEQQRIDFFRHVEYTSFRLASDFRQTYETKIVKTS